MRSTLLKVVGASLITTPLARNVVMIANKVAKLCYLLVISLAKYASESLAENLIDVKIKFQIVVMGNPKTLQLLIVGFRAFDTSSINYMWTLQSDMCKDTYILNAKIPNVNYLCQIFKLNH